MTHVRKEDSERDAEHERWQLGESLMSTERDRDTDPRESETGRDPDHSSGCRNG